MSSLLAVVLCLSAAIVVEFAITTWLDQVPDARSMLILGVLFMWVVWAVLKMTA